MLRTATRGALCLILAALCAVCVTACGTIEPQTILDPLRALLDRLVADGTLTETQANIVARLFADLLAQVLS